MAKLLTQKRPKNGQDINSTAYIYIYMYIYISKYNCISHCIYIYIERERGDLGTHRHLATQQIFRLYIYIYMPAGSPAGWEIIVFFNFAGLRLVGQEIQKERRKKIQETYKKKTRYRESKNDRKKGVETERWRHKTRKKHCFSWEIRFFCVNLFSVCF